MKYGDDIILMNRGNSTVTNPACCSDPRAMCPCCAAAALKVNGAGEAAPGRLTMQGNFDPSDILPLPPPVVVENEVVENAVAASPTVRRAIVVNDHDGDILMCPPVINWAVR